MSTTLLQEVREANPDVIVENDPYCIGYWAFWGRLPFPADPKMQEGWNDAARDARDEVQP